MANFSVSLNEFAAKAKENANEVVKRCVFLLAEEIDLRSPVGNPSLWQDPPPPGYVGGRFRGNWQLGVNVRPAGETGKIDPSGTDAQAEIRAVMPDEAGGNVFYIQNNVPYAMRLELGWSGQAPQGMVGLTAESFESKIEEAASLLDR